MPGISYETLLERKRELGAKNTARMLIEALKSGKMKPDEFSLRGLAEAIVGRRWVSRLHESAQGGGLVALREADAVDVTAFASITGQLVFSKVHEGYSAPGFIGDSLVETVKTTLDGEKIPRMGSIEEEGAEVHPGMKYPEASFKGNYLETPKTTKRGRIVSVTKEAIFFDRTGYVLRNAAKVGERVRMPKEKEILDTVLGILNPYSYNGTAINTYLTTGSWVNSIATNELVDWTDIDAAELLFADMTDPDTGDPILIGEGSMSILVMPAKKHTARRVLGATEVRDTQGANTTIGGNPLDAYKLEVSRLAYKRLTDSGVAAATAKKYWFIGDFKRAFAYMENWPLTVVQAPSNSEAEFERDIVLRYKASERGKCAVLEPRYVVKCTG